MASPIASAATASPSPRKPSRQITTKAPSASRMAMNAKNSAPAKVAIAGTGSRKPRLTMTIASSTTATPNKASRRDQIASRETGSSAGRRRRGGVDGGDARPGERMVGQDFRRRLDGAGNPLQHGAERARVAAGLGHEVDGIAVGRGLHLARIGGLQHGLAGERDRAAADEIAEQRTKQERQAGSLQHRAGAVAVSDVAELMGDDAGKLVGAHGLRDQPLEQIDVPAGQGERIRLVAPQHAGAQRHRQVGGRGEAPDQLVERAAGGVRRFALGALEGGAEAAGVEGRAKLAVELLAELDRKSTRLNS